MLLSLGFSVAGNFTVGAEGLYVVAGVFLFPLDEVAGVDLAAGLGADLPLILATLPATRDSILATLRVSLAARIACLPACLAARTGFFGGIVYINIKVIIYY
jgi:hypothetical protein